MRDALEAIERREMWPLTAGERGRLARAIARAGAGFVAGRGPGKRTDAAVERVWKDAAERISAEQAAAERVRIAEVQRKADAKARRRAGLPPADKPSDKRKTGGRQSTAPAKPKSRVQWW